MVDNDITFHCPKCEAERADFEAIKLHDENIEVSTKLETIGEINNVSTCSVCEYVKVMFDPKNTYLKVFGPRGH